MATREGYIHQNEITTFIFDESIYHMPEPRRIVVTGAFRDWSTDMEDPKWQLHKTSKTIWTLSVNNSNFSKIKPNDEFKFLLNEGKWIHPPHDAPNQLHGNMVFQMDWNVPQIKAELRTPRCIWFEHKGFPRPLTPDAYRLFNAAGKEITIKCHFTKHRFPGFVVSFRRSGHWQGVLPGGTPVQIKEGVFL